ncbi:hypothetical protein yfred0001_32950 [Yersinia frederiksenii ATCC 33641]|nr:hypothetical protein yfred0001_32950 [Yersinia frederiksenii ATCC 33641]
MFWYDLFSVIKIMLSFIVTQFTLNCGNKTYSIDIIIIFIFNHN